MAFAKIPSIVFVRGGTDASFAPPIDNKTNVTAFYCEKFGPCSGNSPLVNLRFTSGYCRQGGGEVHLNVEPLKDGLSAVQLTYMGSVVRIYGSAFVAGKVPIKV